MDRGKHGEHEQHDLALPLVTEEDKCLPLSINIVAKYWDINIPLSEAQEISGRYPGFGGSILVEGIRLAERHGMVAKILHADLGQIKEFIDMGIPPIVILPGIQETIQHASVISGYDPDDRTVMHYIPKMEKDGSFHVGVIPEQTFYQKWSEDGRVAIILSPQDIDSGLRPTPKKSNRLCFESERHSLAGDPKRAAEMLREALSIEPDNITAHSMLAGILNEQNSPDCIRHYEQCIRLNDRFYLAYRGLGNYYLKAKRFDAAERYYSDAIEINPGRLGSIYKNRGIARLEQKDNAGAKSDLKRYLQHSPHAKDISSIRDAIKEL